MKTYSFDIFDTLLGRNVATAEGIFAILREELPSLCGDTIPLGLAHGFIEIRQQAEHLTKIRRNLPEVTLEDIYESIQLQFPAMDPGVLAEIRKREEALEIENSFGIVENIGRVLEHQSKGHRVILISDMYLRRGIIQEMLRKAEPELANLTLYLSCEIGKNKWSGTLFKHVLEQEKIQPSDLLHLGDHPKSDVAQPRKAGAQAEAYTKANLHQHEQAYFREPKNLFLQLYAGASKKCRLVRKESTPAYQLGVTYTGPLFFGFIYNAVQHAIAEGQPKIYFLARDGYLLKEIALAIIDSLKADLEVGYLYVSRQSLLFPSILHLNEGNLHWILENMGSKMTIQLIASRFHMSAEEQMAYFPQDAMRRIGISSHDELLDARLSDALKVYILNHSDLMAAINSAAATQRQVVLDYFKQEGLLQTDNITLVDIGWRGSLQDSIHRILCCANRNFSVTEFYFGVSHYSSGTSPKNRKIPHAIFPSLMPQPIPVLEILLQANHATTLTHRKNPDGKVVPTFKDTQDTSGDWGLSDYAEGVRSFSRTLSQALSTHTVESTFEAVPRILVEKLAEGDLHVASVLGDISYSTNLEDSELRSIAPPFTAWSACKYIVASPRTRTRATQWHEGSYARSSVFAKCILKFDLRTTGKSALSAIIPSHEVAQVTTALRNRLRFLKRR